MAMASKSKAEAAAALAGSSSDETSSQHYTLYFIRHAEALHNQLEKEAQSKALSLAISQGHDANSPHTRQLQEDARKAILESDAMGDPPLSELGFEEAKNAKRSLERLIATHDLPHVEEVWASPLQRAMQTAATIFPDSSDPSSSSRTGAASVPSSSSSSSPRPPIIRVKKEIEERQTGLLCDTHSSFEENKGRKTFRRFSMSSLKIDSLDLPSSEPLAFVVEEKPMLRERTKKLFDLLAETECRSICVVAHKGYLRELERGPLGKTDAEMFHNCEVRVYRLHLDVAEDSNEVLDGSVEGIVDVGGDVATKSPGSPLPAIQHVEKIAESRVGLAHEM